jgi:3-oxoadipyl-CoA thiolase
MPTAVLIDAVRTPVGRYRGALSSVRPDDLAALVIQALLARTRLDPALIDDVYWGAANQAGEDTRNAARMAVLLAGLPVSIPGCTINRLCASGLEAVAIAARMVEAGHGTVFVSGGTESMSRAPWVLPKPEEALGRGNQTMWDSTLGWRMTNTRMAQRYYPFSMGETAENVAVQHNVAREDQDRFALASQQKWAAAHAAGRFADEIVAVPVPGPKKGTTAMVDRDEHPRPDTTLEQLAKLPPAFREGGTVTAGNSSGINDGAAAVLVMEADTAGRLGLQPRAIVRPSATAGVDPSCMGLGPIPATRKVLDRAGWNVADLDLIELNEAFAAQALPCIRELGLPPERVNVNGGAIAIGHPLGCTGARLVTTLLHEMPRRRARRALVTLCVGVGQGMALLLEAP